jgi:hypothetical protein
MVDGYQPVLLACSVCLCNRHRLLGNTGTLSAYERDINHVPWLRVSSMPPISIHLLVPPGATKIHTPGLPVSGGPADKYVHAPDNRCQATICVKRERTIATWMTLVVRLVWSVVARSVKVEVGCPSSEWGMTVADRDHHRDVVDQTATMRRSVRVVRAENQARQQPEFLGYPAAIGQLRGQGGCHSLVVRDLDEDFVCL